MTLNFARDIVKTNALVAYCYIHEDAFCILMNIVEIEPFILVIFGSKIEIILLF